MKISENCVVANYVKVTFDGDTSSADSLYTDESIEENRRIMRTASYWLNGDNTLNIDINTDLIERTLHNLLGDPK